MIPVQPVVVSGTAQVSPILLPAVQAEEGHMRFSQFMGHRAEPDAQIGPQRPSPPAVPGVMLDNAQAPADMVTAERGGSKGLTQAAAAVLPGGSAVPLQVPLPEVSRAEVSRAEVSQAEVSRAEVSRAEVSQAEGVPARAGLVGAMAPSTPHEGAGVRQAVASAAPVPEVRGRSPSAPNPDGQRPALAIPAVSDTAPRTAAQQVVTLRRVMAAYGENGGGVGGKADAPERSIRPVVADPVRPEEADWAFDPDKFEEPAAADSAMAAIAVSPDRPSSAAPADVRTERVPAPDAEPGGPPTLPAAARQKPGAASDEGDGHAAPSMRPNTMADTAARDVGAGVATPGQVTLRATGAAPPAIAGNRSEVARAESAASMPGPLREVPAGATTVRGELPRTQARLRDDGSDPAPAPMLPTTTGGEPEVGASGAMVPAETTPAMGGPIREGEGGRTATVSATVPATPALDRGSAPPRAGPTLTDANPDSAATVQTGPDANRNSPLQHDRALTHSRPEAPRNTPQQQDQPIAMPAGPEGPKAEWPVRTTDLPALRPLLKQAAVPEPGPVGPARKGTVAPAISATPTMTPAEVPAAATRMTEAPAGPIAPAMPRPSDALPERPDGPAATSMPQSPALPPLPAPLQAPETLNLDRPVADWSATLAGVAGGTLLPEGGRLEIRLEPEALGPLSVMVEVSGAEASVTILAASPEAARIIAQAAPDLATAMAAQGLTLSGQQAHAGGQGGHPAGGGPANAQTRRPDDTGAAKPTPHQSQLVNLIA